MRRDTPLCFYDTLSRSKQNVNPVEPGRVTIYTCGPTVYRYAHIGNLRSYLMSDWLRRLLETQGYTVRQVKNITDVGHMRQDMLERGEDKVIAAALAEGKSPSQIAEHYTEAFMKDERRLNVLPAHEFPRATANVAEMVELTRTLVEKGFAYEKEGNVYFDVGRFSGYGKLSRQQAEGLEQGARVETDPLKGDQRDFALWKAAEPGRLLRWPSPWGDGFPGWHIECSAMAAKYLGAEIDFHTGGVDNIFPHHEDEIAQSEAALGHRHVRQWMHGQHLLVDGLKMAKSTGNIYLVNDLERRGFEPLAFRYLCSTARYRSRLNFTLKSLRAAQRGLIRLREKLHEEGGRPTKKAALKGEKLREEFWSAAANDLNLPRALAVAWRVARSRLPTLVKHELLMDFDRLLGFDLVRAERVPDAPAAVADLVEVRDALRRESFETDRQWGLCPGKGRDSEKDARADAIRDDIRAMGYEVRDTFTGTQVLPAPAWANEEGTISSSDDVESFVGRVDEVEFTVSIVAREGCQEMERCVASVRHWASGVRAEILVVDNALPEGCGARLDEIASRDQRVRVFHADHFLGAAAGRNVTLRQARGHYVVMLDTSVELKGDAFTPLRALLDAGAGVAGRWGAVTGDLRSFEEAGSSGEVDAVEGYLIAFRRDLLNEVGLLDEKYRFYRHLDLDLSFAARTNGHTAVIDTELPVARHEHVEWSATPPEERERLSKRNFYRFLRKWGARTDLLVAHAR